MFEFIPITRNVVQESGHSGMFLCVYKSSNDKLFTYMCGRLLCDPHRRPHKVLHAVRLSVPCRR